MAILSLTTGEAPLLVHGQPSEVLSEIAGAAAQSSGGVIFTEHTMPSLEELLEQNRIATATLLPPSGEARVVPRRAAVSTEALIMATAAGGVSMAGWILLVADLVTDPLRVNPYISLALALGGLVLVATLAVAVRTNDR